MKFIRSFKEVADPFIWLWMSYYNGLKDMSEWGLFERILAIGAYIVGLGLVGKFVLSALLSDHGSLQNALCLIGFLSPLPIYTCAVLIFPTKSWRKK